MPSPIFPTTCTHFSAFHSLPLPRTTNHHIHLFLSVAAAINVWSYVINVYRSKKSSIKLVISSVMAWFNQSKSILFYNVPSSQKGWDNVSMHGQPCSRVTPNSHGPRWHSKNCILYLQKWRKLGITGVKEARELWLSLRHGKHGKI